MTIPRIQRDLLARGPEKAHNLNYAYQGASGNGSGNRSYAYYRDMLPAPKVCPCVVSGPYLRRCILTYLQVCWGLYARALEKSTSDAGGCESLFPFGLSV